MKLYQRSKTKISPLQRWTRRRNWEKGQIKYFHKEITFRLNNRWMTTGKRSQTQTNSEIKTLHQITLLLEDLLNTWDENSSKSKLSINFNKYM